MASLRELRRKVKSVKSTQQITKAMKMVAAARLRRAQSRILAARPFAEKMESLVSDALLAAADADGNGDVSPDELGALSHTLLERRTAGPRGILLITADKGLCGAFNTNLIKKALETARESAGEPVVFFCAGRKGRDFLRRLRADVRGEYVNIFNRLSFAHAELIGQDVLKFFLEGGRDVTLIYNEFKSVIQQRLVRTTLLPLTPAAGMAAKQRDGNSVASSAGLSGTTAPQGGGSSVDFIYEPEPRRLLDALFPRIVKARIYRALLESAAAELGARMSAMENATRNAKELIFSLTLQANKIRQAAITKEISEIVAGAEALS